MTERETLIRRLKSIHGIRADKEIELMNHLQQNGLVSDNCVTLADVPLVDLQRAYARNFERAE